jgi:hypothetical protein
MNDQVIENLLRKAPAPKAPADLAETLVAGIRLPRAEARDDQWIASPSFLKRWLPGVCYAAFAATCLGVIGVQGNRLAELKRENETLRAHSQNLDALREANEEVKRLRNENAELDYLRNNEADSRRLQSELARLRAQSDGLAQLRAENQRVEAAAAARPGGKPDFFAEAEARAERISCVNNLKQIGVAARIWANEHNGQLPPDFMSMKNQLPSWRVLQCPGDKGRHIASWAQVAAGDVSYKVSTSGLTENDNPNIVVYECPLHSNVAMLDGSVQQLSEAAVTNQIVTDSNGRRVFSRIGRTELSPDTQ